MKKNLLLFFIFLLALGSAKAQNKTLNEPDSLNEILGSYRFATEKYIIRKQDDKLLMEIPGQGKTGLTPLSKNRFQVDHVSPVAIVEFVKDSLGRVGRFRWIQDVGALRWSRINDGESAPSTVDEKENNDVYKGRYRLKKGLGELIIKEDDGQLTAYVTRESMVMKLSPVSTDQLVYKLDSLQIVFRFEKKQEGKFREIVQTRIGPVEFVKSPENDNNQSLISHTSNARNGFSHADTLRGMLTPLRTCYDVLFYNLDVSIIPDTRSISGSNVIRFKAIENFDSMQVDLYANMRIENIRFHNIELPYRREFNAVFIRFPHKMDKGAIEEIEIAYSGKPQVADASTLTGGFIWYEDKNGRHWIETVCQGAGASLWWPCKDHLSDKPDSMKISVTIPQGLTEISNGQLRAKTDLPGNVTRFDWYVDYPITNYNVVVNIGDYVHFTDQFVNLNDTLDLNYYSLAYNREKAEQVFKNVKPMLVLYEKWFGKYPFKNDGFTAMESLYPMEHQSAVSIGSINNPINSNKFDLKELTRTMWHESAHEWWGNSITCSDVADLWIHEAFATYTETLNYEAFSDKKKALQHLHSEQPENKEPVIGIYNVNNFHLGDMYSKGSLMLHTFRSVLNNDSLFFNLLKNIQAYFRYQSITTENIVDYINQNTKMDFTPFFDQYLNFANIPELELKFTNDGNDSLLVEYRWNAGAKGFNMPVMITKSRDKWSFIYPHADWKQLRLKGIKPSDLKVDTDNFYITVKKEY